MKAKIFIATPTTGGIVKAPYATTLAGTAMSLVDQGFRVETRICDAGELPKQRDALAHDFLHDSDATHMLFIDSDMFAPQNLALKLLSLDKPIVGVIYAKRQPKLAFNVSITDGTQVVDGLCEAEWFGFGYVLVRRDCLETMRERCALVVYENPWPTSGMAMTHGFFQPIGTYGEDISFCMRWRNECNEPLWAYGDADIKHIGDHFYGIPFTDYVRSQNNQANAAALDGSKA
jgi:hypothetical protein